jgi:hypothetical protein
MEALAVILGRFLGAVLAECGPVLAEILAHAIREAKRDTVEDGACRPSLRERLLRRVRDARDRGPDGGAGAPGGAGDGQGLGGGGGRPGGPGPDGPAGGVVVPAGPGEMKP